MIKEKHYSMIMKWLLDSENSIAIYQQNGPVWFISPNRCYAFAVPEGKTQIFNLELVEPKHEYAKFFDDTQAEPLEATQYIEQMGNKVIQKLQGASSDAWVDKKLLDLFPPKDYCYASKGHGQPIFCKHRKTGTIDGMILPVRKAS